MVKKFQWSDPSNKSAPKIAYIFKGMSNLIQFKPCQRNLNLLPNKCLRALIYSSPLLLLATVYK